MRRRETQDPHGKRKYPYRYSTSALRQMLVADIVALRPLGGPGEMGAAWLIGAVDAIAKRTGTHPDEVFMSILAEGASLAGHTNVALA